MNKRIMGMLIGTALVIIGITVMVTMPKKVQYEYEPVMDTEQVRECVTRITGNPKLDIEELLKDKIQLSDIYRYCLRTVDDIEKVLLELST